MNQIGTAIKNIFRTLLWVLSFGTLCKKTVAGCAVIAPGEQARINTISTAPRYEKCFQPLYDTAIIEGVGESQASPNSGGSGNLNFFQVPLGGTPARGVVKTQVQTNMDQGGSLCYPKSFFITGITVTTTPDTAYKDAVKLISNSWFRLFIGTMDHLYVPTNTLSYIANMSEYNYPGPVMDMSEHPLQLIPQQNFRVEVNYPDKLVFSSQVKLQVILHGFSVGRMLFPTDYAISTQS